MKLPEGKSVKLLMIRHAVAAERDEFAQTGEPDDQRPLTDAGRKKMKRAVSGLHDLIEHIDLIASSPLTRAVQTAEVVAKRFPDAAMATVGALEPMQSYQTFLEWLQRLDDVDVIAAIGHEPHLGGLTSWLLTGQEKPLFEFKKGGVCLLEFDGPVEAGAAQLRWLLTPAQLRALDD
jgi:phosphohistidine phosphatase